MVPESDWLKATGGCPGIVVGGDTSADPLLPPTSTCPNGTIVGPGLELRRTPPSKMSPERQDKIRKEAEEELLQMDLRGLRELLGKTQQEIAVLLERSQGQVSETESRKDVRLSTLRSYVEALGGELELIANFGDKRIKLHSA